VLLPALPRLVGVPQAHGCQRAQKQQLLRLRFRWLKVWTARDRWTGHCPAGLEAMAVDRNIEQPIRAHESGNSPCWSRSRLHRWLRHKVLSDMPQKSPEDTRPSHSLGSIGV